ncbi:hypothetical protein SADUNF_Sadunf18G0111300 [Salix dunnii]|uniref:Uncharacterized protein n=1 Tax=Salix dunnii TaxID=1413687 RepID=A0A835J498_9ROSI|nr:hypothetical protein SADUNF_Sadunf18G0111300 [Salix dunnii]
MDTFTVTTSSSIGNQCQANCQYLKIYVICSTQATNPGASTQATASFSSPLDLLTLSNLELKRQQKMIFGSNKTLLREQREGVKAGAVRGTVEDGKVKLKSIPDQKTIEVLQNTPSSNRSRNLMEKRA